MQWLVKVALFVWLFPFIHIPKDTKLLSSVSFLETLRYYYKIMCVDKQLEGSNPSPSEKFTSLHDTSISAPRINQSIRVTDVRKIHVLRR